MHKQILSFLQELKNSHPEMAAIFTQGSCMNLFCILRVLHPSAECYYNSDHVITKIDGQYYDINGVVRKTEDYIKFTEVYRKKDARRAFNQMYKANHAIIKEELHKPIKIKNPLDNFKINRVE